MPARSGPSAVRQSYNDAIAATRKLLGEIAPSPPSEGTFSDLKNQILGIDPNVSTAGIPKFGFRAGLSRADTPQEREKHLTDKLGEGGWGLDTFGNYMVTPSGLERLGLPPSDKPVRIDEPSLTRYDIADLTGEAPAMAGALAAGIATGGAGFLPALAAVGAGGMAGKATGEAVEEFRGENLQTFPEVAADVGMEGLYSAGGEGIMRGILAPIGRRIMAPQAHRLTPETRALVKEAGELGAQPSVSQVTKAPLLGRTQAVIDRIFGDPLAAKNATALNAEVTRLRNATYPTEIAAADVGSAVKADIGSARKALGTWAAATSDAINDLTGGKAIVPTSRLIEAAKEILGELPKHKVTQKSLFTAPETTARIQEIIGGLDQYVTVGQMTRIKGKLYDAIADNTIIPGVSSHDARVLWKAARETFNDAGDYLAATRTPRVTDTGKPYIEVKRNVLTSLGANEKPILQAALKRYSNEYSKRIREFDSAIVKRIMRDPQFAGAMEPEDVVTKVFRKGMHSPLKRVMGLLSSETRDKVRRVAMDDVLASIAARSDDPLVEVFTGKKFLNTLDSYGPAALKAMFGSKRMNELYRLGRVTSMTTSRQALSGGLVAANIALHPWRNLGRLVQFNLLSKFLNSKNGFKWLTEGIKAPRTRIGIAALSRAMTQAQVLLDEHTQETLEGQQP